MNDNTNNTADVLGGTAVAPAPVTPTTPGKAARKRANAAKGGKAKANAGEAKEKRVYTKRGTTVFARRVVLDGTGKPIGRGRKTRKSDWTVVYVPTGMDYDVAIHGKGVRFNPGTKANPDKGIAEKEGPHAAVFKRLVIAKLGYAVPEGCGKVPSAKNTKAAKGAKGAKTAKGANAKGGKGAKAKSKGSKVNAPKLSAPDAIAPVNPAPVTAPATDAVAAAPVTA